MADIRIPIGGGTFIAGRYANRHGLIAGATGSGKSVSLMTLAEGFSAAGVTAFVVDAKGDLSALARSIPARFLDCFGEQGDPARVSMARLGPELLARVLGLSDAQSGVLEILFAIAEARAVAVHTMADLAAVIRFARDHSAEVREQYGHFTPTSLSAISRALVRLEREGGREFFGADSFDFVDLFADNHDGRGRVSILAADRLLQSPSLYAAFMVHLLSDIFERMPEAGDLVAPRLILFIDEAHLLFSDCPPAVLQRIERTMRLVRSKGVGVYFVTQSPADIPANVLGQLGNRIQHALRGATPADLRSIKAAADTLPAAPNFDAAHAIARLGVASALVSTIGASGEPRLAEQVRVALPRCPLGPLLPAERPLVSRPRVAQPRVAPLPGSVATAAAGTAPVPGGNVPPLVAGVFVLVAIGAAGVALFYWWKIALAVALGALLLPTSRDTHLGSPRFPQSNPGRVPGFFVPWWRPAWWSVRAGALLGDVFWRLVASLPDLVPVRAGRVPGGVVVPGGRGWKSIAPFWKHISSGRRVAAGCEWLAVGFLARVTCGQILRVPAIERETREGWRRRPAGVRLPWNFPVIRQLGSQTFGG